MQLFTASPTDSQLALPDGALSMRSRLRIGPSGRSPPEYSLAYRDGASSLAVCELAAALRHVTGSPGLGLLRQLRHAPGH